MSERQVEELTQEQINKAIQECKWLSQNDGERLIPDMCKGYCLPCARVIDTGKCDTLIKLFRGEVIEE